jgi:hypothetical protein
MLYPVSHGALTQLYCATSPAAADANGKFFIPWARPGEANKAAFFFFFLNQFIFRNTSLRLGPVCIYEPIQFKRQGNIEVPTRRVNETETYRGADKGIRKRGAPVG